MKLTITKQTAEEIEIPIPCFAKTRNELLAILDEKTVVLAFKLGNLTIIQNSGMRSDFDKAALAWIDGERISEVEFFQAYDEILESISLTPKLKP